MGRGGLLRDPLMLRLGITHLNLAQACYLAAAYKEGSVCIDLKAEAPRVEWQQQRERISFRKHTIVALLVFSMIANTCIRSSRNDEGYAQPLVWCNAGATVFLDGIAATRFQVDACVV
ncbi:hypothetical protein U9M48_003562 [Paspalum notatum var. saurae]|uniref:Uncharacterized protein n=1 Tax=Paspalum notatum var. saurae TaxID=547442 RepID=A0AAQ3PJ64_PASNO